MFKRILLGWIIFGGMVLYAVALTVVHASKVITEPLRTLAHGDVTPH